MTIIQFFSSKKWGNKWIPWLKWKVYVHIWIAEIQVWMFLAEGS